MKKYFFPSNTNMFPWQNYLSIKAHADDPIHVGKGVNNTKMKRLSCDIIIIQPYLTNNNFTTEDKKFLFSLRSQCYDAKTNFKKLKKGNMQCRLNCESEEYQDHIFQSCRPIFEKLGITEIPNINSIYGTPMEQQHAIKIFVQLDKLRKQLLKDIETSADAPIVNMYRKA